MSEIVFKPATKEQIARRPKVKDRDPLNGWGPYVESVRRYMMQRDGGILTDSSERDLVRCLNNALSNAPGFER